ncbi:C-type lectin domain family 14 member A isoform X2 [Hippocampus zosterae]|uniref:C-type lectin domain family 14 member A isoform X2 n=1 Tax=Hippocampus zosterae TaxID=109293 RepID=UPI00223CEFA6|nr:C-type lectin domain family 14 member A isoform X2 [Hippocampus zosterae]
MLPPPRSVFLQPLVLALTLTTASAALDWRRRYALHPSPLPFEQAQEVCLPYGLASFARPREFARVLAAIAQSPSAGSPAISPTFWVGLKKAKNQCVVPSLPLRGFKWTQGGEDASETRWAHEPEQTCTSVLCAGLVARWDGSAGTRWGLVPLSCKTKNRFICNLESDDGGLDGPQLASPELATPQPAGPESAQPESTRPESAGPTTTGPEMTSPESEGPDSEQKPEIPEPPTPGPAGRESVGPESAHPETAGPEPKEPGRRPDEPGHDAGAESGSGSCPHPAVPGARFLSLDPDNSSRIQVDCWSKVRLDLHCWGRDGVWRLAGGAPANLSTVCTPCGPGYRKDILGDCADVDECSGPHGCRHECVNTAGSYTCVCAQNGTLCEPADSDAHGPLTGVPVPVLVGAAIALVVLALVVGLMIWWCLRRRGKKQKEPEQRHN